MKYGIAIFPSKEIQDDANALRKRYDPRYAQIPPHITVKEAFEYDEKDIDSISNALAEIAKETKPFDIEINKVSTFAPVTNTIYFKVENTPELTTLNEKLHDGIFSTEKDYNFVPHITIAQELSDEEYHDVFGSLKMRHVEFRDTLDRVSLCYQLENGTWQVYETFKFEG